MYTDIYKQCTRNKSINKYGTASSGRIYFYDPQPFTWRTKIRPIVRMTEGIDVEFGCGIYFIIPTY